MQSILGRFDLRVFEIVVFGDTTILTRSVEEWPLVDCLLSWYCAGFPLLKAEAYVKLRSPFCINDLSAEHILRSRVRFYEVLKAHGIPTPVHVIVDRDGPSPPTVIEMEDSIEVNGVKLVKPFVEKPFDAENHDIHIYYPRRLGGGSKRLFRKVNCCLCFLC
jgi:inositol-hexakisphosphate/diphosphoinositol-pentakisphosphate 1-kinase